MRRILPSLSAGLLTGLLLQGCGTPPPVPAAEAPRYEADLDACHANAATAVDARNAKTGLAWFAGPFTRWSRIDDRTAACMGRRGFGMVRSCTAEELRTGGGNRTVTVAGIRCSDPSMPPEARPTGSVPPEPDAPAASSKRRRL